MERGWYQRKRSGDSLYIHPRDLQITAPVIPAGIILFESPCLDDDLYTICVENQLSGWRISLAGFPGYIRISGEFLGENLNFRPMSVIRI